MKPKTIDEYKQWQQKQRNLPLAKLIEKPNCNFDCPKEAPFFCCGVCADEFKHLKINFPNLWDDEKGFLGTDGCRLERKDRPEVCLKAICSKQETLRGIIK